MNTRVLQSVTQGTDEWCQFRLQHHGASEAAAMLGMSPHTKRSELLRMKHSGLPKEFCEWVQVNILDHGHAVEAKARPIIEEKIGDDLYPVTYSMGRLSASCDGLTLDGSIAMEHKQWSESLAARLKTGEMPEEHMPQCQQVMLVTGAQRCLFVVSDGTAERMLSRWVDADPEWHRRLIAGWEQFDKDLAAYVPPAAVEVVTAAPQEHLPAVSVQVSGSLAVVSNLTLFGTALRAFVAKIPAKPSTDQEFADTDAACRRLKEAEDRLQGAEEQALASMADVNDMRRMVAELRELARTTRLASEKMVAARKEAIRGEIVAGGVKAYADHIRGLNDRLGRSIMPQIGTDFAGVIKGKRTVASLQDAVDTELARVKIAANEVADRIAVNLRTLEAQAAHASLFPDSAALALKAPDDLAAVISSRIADHEAKEAKRLEAERERIRAEEQAKAQREAQQAEAARLAEERQAEAARQAQEVAQQAIAQAAAAPATAPMEHAPIQAAQAPAAAPAAPLTLKQVLDAVAPAPVAQAVRADEPATLKLGIICERLGFTVNAAFLADTLHIQPAATDRAAKLYRESQWPLICQQLQAHIGAMAELYGREVA